MDWTRSPGHIEPPVSIQSMPIPVITDCSLFWHIALPAVHSRLGAHDDGDDKMPHNVGGDFTPKIDSYSSVLGGPQRGRRLGPWEGSDFWFIGTSGGGGRLHARLHAVVHLC